VRRTYPGLPILRPQADLTRIHVDRDDLRRLTIRWLKFSRLHLLDLLVALARPLAAQPFCDPLHVLAADGQIPHVRQVLGCLLEGLLMNAGVFDLG